jgi:hypothetical protein
MSKKESSAPSHRIPSDSTLRNVFRLAVSEDKPIMMDYWVDSLEKKAMVGSKESGEKLLVKSENEYTSCIKNFYKSETEYIVITENSIYIVSNDIPIRKIS